MESEEAGAPEPEGVVGAGDAGRAESVGQVAAPVSEPDHRGIVAIRRRAYLRG